MHYLKEKKIRIWTDGKGRATENIWIERFWKTIKYNHIYLNPCDTCLELFEGVQTVVVEYTRSNLTLFFGLSKFGQVLGCI